MKKLKVTPQDLAEAVRLYPDPKFTKWYRMSFPKRAFIITELVLFGTGFLATVLNDLDNPVLYFLKALATILFTALLIPAGVCHVLAWVLMRRVEKKRAEYLGITLREYFDLLRK